MDSQMDVVLAGDSSSSSSGGGGVGSSSSATAGELAKEEWRRKEDLCNKIPFIQFCRILEKVEKTPGTQNKLKLVFNDQLTQATKGQSIYPLVRLLLPLNDSERGKYNLKQHSLIGIYITALSLNGAALERLNTFKAAGTNKEKDISVIMEQIIAERCSNQPSTKTLGDVNTILDRLSQARSKSSSSGETSPKLIIMRDEVIRHFSPLEQKWILRIIFGASDQLKIGLKHEPVLRHFGDGALQRYNECTNLRQVLEGHYARGIAPNSAFNPMVSRHVRETPQGFVRAIENLMGNNSFVIDIKLDGERMLFHRKHGHEPQLYSRKNTDYSSIYRTMLSVIDPHLRPDLDVIIDGEVLAWKKADEKALEFSNNKTVANEEAVAYEASNKCPGWDTHLNDVLKYVVFDIVYIKGPGAEEIIREAAREVANGIIIPFNPQLTDPLTGKIEGPLLHLPLAIRRRVLEKVLQPVPYRLNMVKHTTVVERNVEARCKILEDKFDEAMMDMEEGLVVKALNTPYLLGEEARRKNYWLKMKPEYADMLTDVDVAIIGAYYGDARNYRGGGASSFLVGIRTSKSSEKPPKMIVLGKVGSGYGMVKLTEIRAQIEPHLVPIRAGDQSVKVAKANELMREKCSSWLEPWTIMKSDDVPDYMIPVNEQTIVCSLKISQFVTTDEYGPSMTQAMRFPRVVDFKDDRTWDSVTDKDEIDQIARMDRKKIKEFEHLLFTGGAAKRSAGTKGKKKPSVGSSIGAAFKVGSEVRTESDLLKDLTFAVCDNFPLRGETKQSMQDLIKRYGGEEVGTINDKNGNIDGPAYVAHRSEVGKYNLKVNHLIVSRMQNVLDSAYIRRCIAEGRVIPRLPSDFISFTEATHIEFLALGHMLSLYGTSFAGEKLMECDDEDEDDEQDASVAAAKAKIKMDRMVSLYKHQHADVLDKAIRIAAQVADTSKKRPAPAPERGGSKKRQKPSEEELRLVMIKEKLAQDSMSIVKDLESIYEPADAAFAKFSSSSSSSSSTTRKLKDWRTLAAEQSETMYNLMKSEAHALWGRNVVLYFDVFNDLGSIEALPPALACREEQAMLVKGAPRQIPFSVNVSCLLALAVRLRFKAATISANLHAGVTHIIMCANDMTRANIIHERIRELRRGESIFEKRLVNEAWVDECLSQNYWLIPEERHIVTLP